jgi:polysaccharide biosynthesis protein PslG
MLKLWTIVTLFFLMTGCSTTQSTEASDLQPLGLSHAVPNSMGVLVHDFSDTNLNRASQAGFKVVRMDLEWGAVETVIKGQYNWSEYDVIINRLKARGLRPMLILDFNNPLYNNLLHGEGYMDGIDTPQEREGFKNFAVAAVKRYQDLVNPIWEIYNEPNRPTFWSDPSAEEYMKLVKVVVPAMRQAKSNLFIIGPALGHAPSKDGTDEIIKVDFGYLESTFALGILNYVDAVSIHPYPDGEPELALGIYYDVRYLMNMYAPGKNIPIVSSEWGYSSAAGYLPGDKLQAQANYLTRMYLINVSQKVLSIAYKLEYGSPDPSADAYEKGFSWFKRDGQANPVYAQVQKMIAALKGLSFVKRLASGSEDYLLEFSNGPKTVTAAWTTGTAHRVTIYNKSVTLSGKPVYITK